MLKLAIICGLMTFALIVALPVMLVSDVTEHSVLSWMATAAEHSKEAAINDSPQMMAARREIADLGLQLAESQAYCQPEPTLKSAMIGWLPWIE